MAGGACRPPFANKGLWSITRKVKRLMREHDLQPRMRRRYTATTDSDHDHPIFRNLAKDKSRHRRSQSALGRRHHLRRRQDAGFVYVAVVLDAWSRRVVGYSLSRSIDVRLTLAALNAAVENRRPPPGCLHHSGPWIAIRRTSLSASPRQAWPRRFDGPAAAIPKTTPKPKAS